MISILAIKMRRSTVRKLAFKASKYRVDKLVKSQNLDGKVKSSKFK